VRCVIISGALDKVFCAGANIHMLASSSHGFKVNFCKFTNETRLSIEDASRNSGQRYLAALNGACAGGGYELAMACDEILLIEDGNSTVSLPETPLLAVLPGTGGLTRLVDKRKVRRDLADVFCTTAEGVKGKRAVEWGLVDAIAPRSRFAEAIDERPLRRSDRRARRQAGRRFARAGDARCRARAARQAGRRGPHRLLPCLCSDRPRTPAGHADRSRSRGRPAAGRRGDPQAGLEMVGARRVSRAGRLRVNEAEIGLILLKTEGEIDNVLALDETLHRLADDWFVGEVRAFIARTLRRLDLTARSLFALIEPGSCFAGTLFELALAADRSYMLDDPDQPVALALSAMNGGAYPMTHDVSRLVTRFLGTPERPAELLAEPGRHDPEQAGEAGLVTIVADDIDYEDEVRLAIEERVSISPDALTGMEASLRFPGAENCDSKIFGRLSAWQNWIFQRPNAVGEKGALTLYAQPDRPSFDFRRT